MTGRTRPAQDWPAIAYRVAVELLGEPNSPLSNVREWRWGRRGSFALQAKTGRWYDFESDTKGGALDLVMRETGLDQPAAFEWLRSRGLVDAAERRVPASAATNPNARGSSERAGDRQPVRRNTADYGRHLWRSSQTIPTDPGHPARRWLARRNLWRPDLPLPAAVRWLPDYDRRHTGAGALVAVAAQPAAWLAAWPNTPQPAAVQLVSIDAEGNPAPDRPADTGGLDKRTLGARDGAVVLLGNPSLAVAVAPVEVAEGLADALALAARADAPAIATLGTGEMVSGNLAHWLADASRVRVYADRDAAKDGRPPAGLRAARALVRAVESAGGHADAVHAPDPHKDAAAYAAAVGFPSVADGWDEYAKTLAETTDWPRWEIARLAAIAYCAED